MEVDGCVKTLLQHILEYGCDDLDAVLLELLLDEFAESVEESTTLDARNRLVPLLCEWCIFEFMSSALSRPSSADSSHLPVVRIGLGLLKSVVKHASLFTYMLDKHAVALERVEMLCQSLEPDSNLMPRVLGFLLVCQEHPPGRTWLENTGLWRQYLNLYMTHSGGRLRPELERQMVKWVCLQMEASNDAVEHTLEYCKQFLIVMPSRRFVDTGTRDPPWLTCCKLINKLLFKVLQSGARISSSLSDTLKSLTVQVRGLCFPPCDLAVAQLWIFLHLMNERIQSRTQARDSSSSSSGNNRAADDHLFSIDVVRQACVTASQSAETPMQALKAVITLILDTTLLMSSCHDVLVAAAIAPICTVLSSCRETDTTETALIRTEFCKNQLDLAAEFVQSEPAISMIVDAEFLSSHSEDALRIIRSVFLSRTEARSSVSHCCVTVQLLAQTWIDLLLSNIVFTTKSQADTLAIIGGLLSRARSESVGDQPGVRSLDKAIVKVLSETESEHVSISAVQCLRRSARWLVDPAVTSETWRRLGECLLSVLGRCDWPDSVDTVGQTVASMVDVGLRPAQRPLVGWLADCHLPSSSFTALLRAGPGERRSAAELLTVCAALAAAGETRAWTDLVANVRPALVLESCMDGGLLFDTVGLQFLETSFSLNLEQSIVTNLSSEVICLYIQSGLASGEVDVRHAAENCAAAVISRQIKHADDSAITGWLNDGMALAVLRLCERCESIRLLLTQLVLRVSNLQNTSQNSSDHPSTPQSEAFPVVPPQERDSIARSVLSESTGEFLCRSVIVTDEMSRGINALRTPTGLSLSQEQFLQLVKELETDAVKPSQDLQQDDVSVKMMARVEEIQRCAHMDSKLDAPTDCY